MCVCVYSAICVVASGSSCDLTASSVKVAAQERSNRLEREGCGCVCVCACVCACDMYACVCVRMCACMCFSITISPQPSRLKLCSSGFDQNNLFQHVALKGNTAAAAATGAGGWFGIRLERDRVDPCRGSPVAWVGIRLERDRLDAWWRRWQEVPLRDV